MTVRVPTPVGDLPQQYDYSDFRTVDGVKLPFVTHADGGQPSLQTWTEVKQNVPVADSEFAPPKGSAPHGK